MLLLLFNTEYKEKFSGPIGKRGVIVNNIYNIFPERYWFQVEKSNITIRGGENVIKSNIM
jgi:hypothetical protein